MAANIVSAIGHGEPKKRFDGSGWCVIEMGGGVSGFGSGNFLAPKGPQIKLYSPARCWHWGKVLFEKWWLWRWF